MTLHPLAGISDTFKLFCATHKTQLHGLYDVYDITLEPQQLQQTPVNSPAIQHMRLAEEQSPQRCQEDNEQNLPGEFTSSSRWRSLMLLISLWDSLSMKS